MRYNQSSAYDYNRISTAPSHEHKQQRKAKISQLSVKQVKKSTSTKLVFNVAVVAIVMLLMAFNIYTRAEISETNKQIENARSQIEELDSELIQLNMDKEKIVAYSNLEEEAIKLGMQKKSRSQIHYIDISNGDSVEVLDSNK